MVHIKAGPGSGKPLIMLSYAHFSTLYLHVGGSAVRSNWSGCTSRRGGTCFLAPKMEDRDLERGLLGPGQEPRQQTIPREIDSHLPGLEVGRYTPLPLIHPSLPQSSTTCTIAPFGIPLYTYQEVPPFLKGNPYITEGYRAHLSPELCAKRFPTYSTFLLFFTHGVMQTQYIHFLCVPESVLLFVLIGTVVSFTFF